MTDFTAELLTAFEARCRFTPRSALPATRAEAEAVQARAIRALGGAGAFKIGLQSEGAPIIAPIPRRRCFESGAIVPVAADYALELEVGWKLVSLLPDAGHPDFETALRAAVRPLPVIEMVRTRLEGPAAADPLARLADFQISDGIIEGAVASDWEGRDFDDLTGELSLDGERLEGPGLAVPGGSAWTTLLTFLRHPGSHCGGFRPGQVLITGTTHPMHHLRRGGLVDARIDGLGSLAASLRQD